MDKKESNNKFEIVSTKTAGGLYKNIKIPIKTLDIIIAIMGTILLLIIFFQH